MTPHAEIQITPEVLAALGGPNLVYVRPVSSDEIIAAVPAEVVESAGLEPHQTLYAVHRGDGERIAVLGDRDTAFAAALSYDLAPVSVH